MRLIVTTELKQTPIHTCALFFIIVFYLNFEAKDIEEENISDYVNERSFATKQVTDISTVTSSKEDFVRQLKTLF